MADRGFPPLRTTLRVEPGPVVGTRRATYLEIRRAFGRAARPQILLSRVVEGSGGEGRCIACLALDVAEAKELAGYIRDIAAGP